MKKSLLLTLLLLGCNSDKTLTPCASDIEVGIFEPTDFEIYPEGFDFEVKAIVRDLCGRDLSEASFSLSSDLRVNTKMENRMK